MGIFISVGKTIECVAVAFIFAALLCACAFRLTGILQSCGYSGKKLIKWAKKKNNLAFGRHALLAFLCVLASAVISLCFSFLGEYAAITGLAAYLIFFSLYIWADNRVALRSPAAITPRFKRLYICFFVICAVLSYLAVTLLNFADYVWGNTVFSLLRYCPLAVFPLILIPLLALSNNVSKIYEIPHNRRFVKKARDKLAAADIKVIGITGSYGKTSVKKILAEILSQKYNVLATPRSHNTPMGLALTLNSNDLENYDVFIAEMGARNVGDIAELVEMCPPDYAVITGICPQHLESFGSMENIVKAKGEILCGSVRDAVIARDCYDLFEGYVCAKDAAPEVLNLVCSPEGSAFTVVIDGGEINLKTKLLGGHAAENIALAAALAEKLGLTGEEIAAAVEKLDYIEHRLQLIKSNGVNILDDGYNSNVRGAAAALEVLRSFGGAKIAVTPGLVELGILEESENYELGKKLVGLDFVILVGDTLVAPVRKGFSDGGGDMQKIVTTPSLSAAQEELKKVIKAGDTVLFLNDLPDIY